MVAAFMKDNNIKLNPQKTKRLVIKERRLQKDHGDEDENDIRSREASTWKWKQEYRGLETANGRQGGEEER